MEPGDDRAGVPRPTERPQPPRDQRAYWDRVAGTKRFTHPLDADRLRAELDSEAPILDVGCGHGRLSARLRELGFERVVGVDTSAAMIARGRTERPSLDLRTVEPGPLPFPDRRFAAALLVSVLTCIPSTADEIALIGEVQRVLRPGGLVFVSDLLLQEGERNRARYAAWPGPEAGVFELPEGVVLRHFERAEVERLFASFETSTWSEIDVFTMNGNAARAFQLVARRRPDA